MYCIINFPFPHVHPSVTAQKHGTRHIAVCFRFKECIALKLAREQLVAQPGKTSSVTVGFIHRGYIHELQAWFEGL